MSANNKNKKESKSKIGVRILCIVLAALMVGSVAYLAIQLIFEGIASKKEDENKKDTSKASVAEIIEAEKTEDIYTVI